MIVFVFFFKCALCLFTLARTCLRLCFCFMSTLLFFEIIMKFFVLFSFSRLLIPALRPGTFESRPICPSRIVRSLSSSPRFRMACGPSSVSGSTTDALAKLFVRSIASAA